MTKTTHKPVKQGEWGAVFYVKGPRTGERGEYDDDDDEDGQHRAIVYPASNDGSGYDLVPLDHLRHCTDTEAQQVEWNNRKLLNQLKKEGKE